MSKFYSCEIYVDWSARAEKPAALATRFLRTVDALSALDPSLQKWTWGDAPELTETDGGDGKYPFETIIPRLADAIERNAGLDEYGMPDPTEGYWMMVGADRMTDEPGPYVSVTAGRGQSYGPEIWYDNSASIDFGPDPAPHMVTYSFMREAMLILCETWDATFGEAYPADVRPDPLPRPYTPPPIKRTVWMKYLSPRFAPLVTPPASVIAEHRPDGGLFLAATNETFNVSNPAHMAAASDLETALKARAKIPGPASDLDR